MAKKKIEPTPEDWQRVRDAIANSRERLMESLVRQEARERTEREQREHRRRRLRRLFPFRRAA